MQVAWTHSGTVVLALHPLFLSPVSWQEQRSEYSMAITITALWYLEISQSIQAISAYSSFFFFLMPYEIIDTNTWLCKTLLWGYAYLLLTVCTHKTTDNASKSCLNPPWLHPSSSTTPSFFLLRSINSQHSPRAEKPAALFEENTGITRWICTGWFFFF